MGSARRPPNAPGDAASRPAGLPAVVPVPPGRPSPAGTVDSQSKALMNSGVGRALYSGLASSRPSCAANSSRNLYAPAGWPCLAWWSASNTGRSSARRSTRVTWAPSASALRTARASNWPLWEPSRALPATASSLTGAWEDIFGTSLVKSSDPCGSMG